LFIIGKDENDQVQRIFEKCGTPTEEYWPGVSNLNNYTKYAPTRIFPRTLKSYYMDNKKYLLVYNDLKLKNSKI